MPRDDWAKARARDAVKRVERQKFRDSLRWKKPKKSKAKRRQEIRDAMKNDARNHAKSLGTKGRPRIRLVHHIPAGTAVEIRKIATDAWRPYVTRRDLNFKRYTEAQGFVTGFVEGWFIRQEVRPR